MGSDVAAALRLLGSAASAAQLQLSSAECAALRLVDSGALGAALLQVCSADGCGDVAAGLQWVWYCSWWMGSRK